MQVEITIQCDTIQQIHNSLADIKKALRTNKKQRKLKRTDTFTKPLLVVSRVGNWALGVDIE